MAWGAVILLLLWPLILLSRPESAAAQQPRRWCGAGDLAALRGFSVGLDAAVAGWPIANASDDGCCDWPGVECDAAAAAVVGLVLPNRTLQGEVSPSLAGLATLRVLNLSGNALRGAIPAALLRLRSLEVLDVSANSLAGGLGAAAAAIELPALRVFNVSGNAFNGSHPVLPGAANLTEYDASGNTFAGAVDAAALCGGSPALRVVRLSMNSLSGEFSAGFGQCRWLTELSLDGNGIGGAIPDDLFGVASLKFLSLHTNAISGELSPRLRNLTGIVRLDLSFNAISGDLPDVFDALLDLQELSAPSNNLSGELPRTLSRCRRLRVLNLRNNSFSGDIGLLDFRALRELSYLDLGVNGFTGQIPASLPECRAMTALNLGRNKLAGEIPASFASFTSLSFLSLTGNAFSNVSSALRTLQGLRNLTSLVLTKNFHGGEELPPDIIAGGGGGFPSIQVLVIANCELHGEIPAWIAGLRKLRVLDLSWNRLAGPIPPWIGELDRLFYLDISNNSLHGEIPSNLTRIPGFVAGGLGSADEGDAEVQDFPFFMRRNTSVQGRQYNQVSSFPPSLVLSHNDLTGGVPAALGGLTKLHIVDLSWNKLSGPIPPELSEMSSLESLDFSHNSLSGPIPPSLTRLSFLSHLDVSHNNLSGEVPVGGQFSTFSRADFDGNPFLCGFHAAPCRAPPAAGGGGRGSSTASAGVVAAISVGTALLLAVAAAATWRVWSKRQEDNARVAADDDNSGRLSSSAPVLLFPDAGEDDGNNETRMTVEDVMKATCNFDESRIVGCGGFGMVYRATLPGGRDAAVKRLSGDLWQVEREFRAEVETLSRVRHRNLVPLRGYCRAGNHDRLLIYPYMENGSLDHWLHERSSGAAALTWPARLRIARGAARGLAHLHDATSEPRVLHRDIKSSNILLDAGMEPRLADFGLARLVKLPTDTHVTTDLVGTLGYIPPEYGHSSVATYRGDVYSFGVVLMELVTGRRPVDMARPVGAGGGRDVTSWAVRLRREGRGQEVIDAGVLGEDGRYREEAAKVLDVACACVSENPKARPTAQQVVEWLDAIAASSSADPPSTNETDQRR
ncbi:unnamed protein product [Urochloa decumbens]|uniref:non-specific serine/threonine protein kinase n=1 Tax=Urochloa decumbens TaxID=240449 RepID=A0ABC9EPC7_9POAL